MRARTARLAVVAALCATATLVAPAAAFADSTPTTIATITTPAPSQWANSESAYLAKRHAIRLSYQSSVEAARSTFAATVAHVKNPQVRRSARRALLNAIAAADASQVAALAQLGPGPSVSGELDGAEYELELVAINQDYADAVNAARSSFQAQVAAATSAAQIVAARAAMKLAIATATSNRSDELAALGSPPLRRSAPTGSNANGLRLDN